MLAVLCALAAVVAPQDTGMLDVPVYRNAAFGVSLPRPFDDWVFSAGRSPRTTTVLFHPRSAPLREQLWGALVLTGFDGPVPVGAVADQRIETTWRPELGQTFRLLTRDSLTVAGLPAIHIVMAGAVGRLAVDVEEYAIAHGRDLIVLQFRYPRGLPRDSIAAGYERTLAGFAVGTEDAVRASAPPPVRRPAAVGLEARRLDGSMWVPRSVDARLRIEAGSDRIAAVARLEVVNTDVLPRDSVLVALRAPWVVDSVQGPTGRTVRTRSGVVVAIPLPQPVEASGTTAVTLFYRLSPPQGAEPATRDATGRSFHLHGWIPLVEPWADSAGNAFPATLVRRTVRFDMPLALAAVTSGRLAVDVTTGERRQMTWVAEREDGPAAMFVVGPLRRALVRPGPLVSVRVWVDASAESGAGASRVREVADAAAAAWASYTRAFGRLTASDAEVVLSDAVPSSVSGASLVLSPSASLDAIRTTVARVWWGQVVRFVGPRAEWMEEALASWSALALRAATDGDSVRQRLVREAEADGGPLVALEAARRAAGDAAFRSALRELFLNYRGRTATLADLRQLLGASAAAVLPAVR